MVSVQQAYDLAVAHHRAGRLGEAEALYRHVLTTARQAEVYNNLGGVLADQGRRQEAIDEYRRALSLDPRFAEASNNLGLMLLEMGQVPDAMGAFREALRLRPDFPEAQYNLGNAHKAIGETGPAIQSYRRCLAIRPDMAAAHYFLAVALLHDGLAEQSLASLQTAIKLRPDYADAFNTRGLALRKLGRAQEAVEEFGKAISIRNDFADAYNNLGGALASLGRGDDAIAAYQKAVDIEPNFPEALYNLATSFIERGRLEEAIVLNRRAIELRPHFVEAIANLATALKYSGQMDEALECHRRALSIKADPIVADNLLLAVYFHPDYTPLRIKQEHDRWNRAFAAPFASMRRAHPNDRNPDRRLKVGYVSPDFREHPVGRFMLPLLSNHDRGAVETVCYADVRRDDEMTQSLRSRADHWVDATGLSDEQLARRVESDQIDVLVDLTMHLEYNRMFVFARKPAPVQVSYLAYCGTTGLDAMDYRISDPYLDPPGIDETVYSERTIRLPRTYWCYPPSAAAPATNALPALTAGHISFGCLNNYAKVTAPTLEMWERLLIAVPNSTLTLFCPDSGARDRARRLFAQAGVDAERLRFVRLVPLAKYFALYHHIDIALDPYPYGGGTTTCDALYMGVPVITRTGQTAVSRGGLSILSNLGLEEFVTHSPQDYVRVAAKTAGDLPRLSQLRASLRQRMGASALMDGGQFAKDVEAAYRQMWQTWCSESGTSRVG
ncbi:MAG TPA: tetratricopeptide repeat protein [Tepidisphaeraceae bacterium]|jgi:predicted O-linked N-acetylglucosamine transferase (SPINDLY family)